MTKNKKHISISKKKIFALILAGMAVFMTVTTGAQYFTAENGRPFSAARPQYFLRQMPINYYSASAKQQKKQKNTSCAVPKQDEISYNLESGPPTEEVSKSLAVSSTNPNIVYIGTEWNGIFKSSDGGVKWQWLKKGLACILDERSRKTFLPAVIDIIINPLNESMLFASTGLGRRFTGESERGGTFSQTPYAEIYQSKDAGKNWKNVLAPSGIRLEGSITSLAFNPANPFEIIAVSSVQREYDKILGSVFYKSTNNGKTWKPLPLLAGANDVYHLLYLNDGIYALAGDSQYMHNRWISGVNAANNSLGLIKSIDGGMTWTQIPMPQTGENSFDYLEGTFEIAPSDPNIIYLHGKQENEIYKTSDGGQTWQNIPLGLSSGRTIKISPEDPNRVLFDLDGSLYLSTDGLITFRKVVDGTGMVYDIEFAKSNPNIIYAAAKGYNIFKSTDGGETFEAIVNLWDLIERAK